MFKKVRLVWKFDEVKDATEIGPPGAEQAPELHPHFSSADCARTSAARCAFNWAGYS